MKPNNSPSLEGSRITSAQHGMALVESLLLFVLFLPLLYLLITLGNLIDIQQSLLFSSRFKAWEHTVHTTVVEQDKFNFPQTSRTWKVVDSVASPVSNASPLLPTLVTFAAGGGGWLDSNQGSKGVALQTGNTIAAMGSALDYLDNVQWGLTGDGILDAGLQVNVLSDLALPGGGRNCQGERHSNVLTCLSANNSIMVDAWDVATNSMAEDRTRALVPAAAFQPLGQSLSLLGEIPVLQEWQGLEHALGFVDSTQLPPDRFIGTYRRAR